jgi:hypothetical protein
MFTIDMLTHLNDADLDKAAYWLSYEVSKFRERYRQEKDEEDRHQMLMHREYLIRVQNIQNQRKREIEK